MLKKLAAGINFNHKRIWGLDYKAKLVQGRTALGSININLLLSSSGAVIIDNDIPITFFTQVGAYYGIGLGFNF